MLLLIIGAVSVARMPDVDVMQAVQVHGHCNIATNFSCVGFSAAVPVPQPGSNQVLLKVGGSSVNPCDSDTVNGVRAVKPPLGNR